MRRIGSGSRAIWCSRPARVRRTSPARSSTFTCFETALNDMSKGWTRSVTRAAPFASRWTISRRVGSESAAKARSRTGVVIYSTYGLNIATGPPMSSDRRTGDPRRDDTARRCVHVLGRVRSRCHRSDSTKGSTMRATEGVFREAAERSHRNPGPYPPSLCVLPDCRRATDRKGAPNRLAQAFRMPGRIRFQRFAPEARRARLHRGPRVAVWMDSTNRSHLPAFAAMEATAERLKVRLQRVEVRTATDLDGGFAATLRQRAEAVAVYPLSTTQVDIKRIGEFAIKNRLPTVTNTAAYIPRISRRAPGRLRAERSGPVSSRGDLYRQSLEKGPSPLSCR